jgi:signal transduction histidine kinase
MESHRTTEPNEPESRLNGLGRFAAHLAHEINNPLAGISNAAVLLRTAVPPSHPQYQYLAIIEREVARIAEVTRQMCRSLGAETARPQQGCSGSEAA